MSTWWKTFSMIFEGIFCVTISMFESSPKNLSLEEYKNMYFGFCYVFKQTIKIFPTYNIVLHVVPRRHPFNRHAIWKYYLGILNRTLQNSERIFEEMFPLYYIQSYSIASPILKGLMVTPILSKKRTKPILICWPVMHAVISAWYTNHYQ